MVSDREEVYIPGSSFDQAEGSKSRPADHYYLLLFAERLQLLRKRAEDHIECLFSDLHIAKRTRFEAFNILDRAVKGLHLGCWSSSSEQPAMS